MAVSTKTKIIGGAVVGVIAVAWIGGALITKSKTEDDMDSAKDIIPIANMMLKANTGDVAIKSFDKVDGGLFSDAYKLVMTMSGKDMTMLFNNSFGFGSVKSNIELNDDCFAAMGLNKELTEIVKDSLAIKINGSNWSKSGAMSFTFDDGKYSMDKGTFKWGDIALNFSGSEEVQGVEFKLPDFSFEMDDKNWLKIDDVYLKTEGEFLSGKGTNLELRIGDVDSKRGQQEINISSLDVTSETECNSSMLCEGSSKLSLKGFKFPSYEIGKTKLKLNVEGLDFAAAAKACGLEPKSENFVSTVTCLKESDDKLITLVGKKSALDIDFETSVNDADVSFNGEFKVTADDMSNPMMGLINNGFKAKATLKVDKELFKAIPMLSFGQPLFEQFDPGASTYKLKLECEGIQCKVNGKPLN